MDLLEAANMALDIIGHRNIGSLNGSNEDERVVQRWINHTWKNLARKRWNFQRRTSEKLVRLHDSSGKIIYQLPADYAIIDSQLPADYTVIGKHLHCSNELGTIDYYSDDQRFIADAPETFVAVFVAELAKRLSLVLAKSPEVGAAAEKAVIEATREAMFSQDIERRPTRAANGIRNFSTWTRGR